MWKAVPQAALKSHRDMCRGHLLCQLLCTLLLVLRSRPSSFSRNRMLRYRLQGVPCVVCISMSIIFMFYAWMHGSHNPPTQVIYYRVQCKVWTRTQFWPLCTSFLCHTGIFRLPMHLGCGIFQLSSIFTHLQPVSPILHPPFPPSVGTPRRQALCTHIDLSTPWGPREGRVDVAIPRDLR